MNYFGAIAEKERNNGRDVDVHGDLPARYLVASLMYMERVRATGLKLTALNVHRLVLVGVILAAKVLDDRQPKLKFFADVGGLSETELAALEWTFLEIISYRVLLAPDSFANFYATVLGVSP